MEKPILFNTEMVKVILEGRKTQTRRIIKIPKGFEIIYADKKGHVKLRPQYFKQIKPPCQVGDTLWVRETWLRGDDGYHYKADISIPSESEDLRIAYGYKYKPSIHMPKSAARLFLKVTNVRVERLQDITKEGAQKEGFHKVPGVFTAKELFEAEWDGIYKNWNENPWVWVIEFERI